MKHIFCTRLNHYKDIIVCLSRCDKWCREFKNIIVRDREEFWTRVKSQYNEVYADKYLLVYDLIPLMGKGAGKMSVTKEKLFIGVGQDGQLVLGSDQDIIQAAEEGKEFKNIYAVGNEHELVLKLVPKRSKSASGIKKGDKKRKSSGGKSSKTK